MPPPTSTPRQPLKTALYVAYFVLAVAYMSYSLLTQTGLCGWLTAWQIRLFGSASDKATALLAILVLLVPPLALASRFDRRGLAAAAGQPVPGAGVPARPATFRALAIMAAVPALLAVLGYFWLKTQAEHNAQQPVHQLNLIEQPAATLPAEAKYAIVQGVAQPEYQYVLQETRYGKVEKTDRYLPLTGPDWRPGQPVQLLWDTSIDAYYDETSHTSADLDHSSAFPGTFSGDLGLALPTVVRQEFEHQGLHLAESVYVLHQQYFVNGRPVDYDSSTYYLLPWLGLGLSAAILLGGGIGLAIRRARGLA